MKDITKNEIAKIIHVLAYLAKINNVVDPAEKKIFKIVCERFGIKIPDLKEILKESVSLRKSLNACLLYTSPSPRDRLLSRMPSSA